MSRVADNRQARKTCAAIHSAFRDLFLSCRYEDIRVADILRRADVGRSTFYEHFRNKDDLFRQSMLPIASALAEAAGDKFEPDRLVFVLEHFRDTGRIARGFLKSPSASLVVEAVGEQIHAQLRARQVNAALPRAFIAAQLAEAECGMIRAWLTDRAPCSAVIMAATLRASLLALRASLTNSA
jgi:AcrR family transcriptional regulator